MKKKDASLSKWAKSFWGHVIILAALRSAINLKKPSDRSVIYAVKSTIPYIGFYTVEAVMEEIVRVYGHNSEIESSGSKCIVDLYNECMNVLGGKKK